MIEKHQTYRPLIFAARCLTAPIALYGCLFLLFLVLRSLHNNLGKLDWQEILSWEMAGGASAVAYAIFTFLPIQQTRPRIFWPAIVLGTLLAIGSTWLVRLLYASLVVEGHLVFHIMACLLLLPLYAYIPITILNRKYETSGRQSKLPESDTPASMQKEPGTEPGPE